PAAASQVPAAGRAAKPDPPPAAAAPRALVVDDSDVAQRFLQLRLAAYGIVAECVATSQQALDRLLQRNYDFVFLDLELGPASPYDGLGLCQKIRREFATRMPPPQIVVITAHHGELDRVRAALAGSDGFLGKPLDETAFDRLLARQGFVRLRQGGPP
ncbi:MAG: response regulator, partial [Burkholderiales bacterium]|nr:response regulator [Burkholderiales bacterium]